jgi:hypothetical protein
MSALMSERVPDGPSSDGPRRVVFRFGIAGGPVGSSGSEVTGVSIYLCSGHRSGDVCPSAGSRSLSGGGIRPATIRLLCHPGITVCHILYRLPFLLLAFILSLANLLYSFPLSCFTTLRALRNYIMNRPGCITLLMLFLPMYNCFV